MNDDERGEDWPTDVERLVAGEPCEYQYPAVRGWHPGTVVVNGGAYYWKIREEDGRVGSFWIEGVRTVQPKKPGEGSLRLAKPGARVLGRNP